MTHPDLREVLRRIRALAQDGLTSRTLNEAIEQFIDIGDECAECEAALVNEKP